MGADLQYPLYLLAQLWDGFFSFFHLFPSLLFFSYTCPATGVRLLHLLLDLPLESTCCPRDLVIKGLACLFRDNPT